jgi:hypothetical protein
MQRLEVSGAVLHIYMTFGGKGLSRMELYILVLPFKKYILDDLLVYF